MSFRSFFWVMSAEAVLSALVFAGVLFFVDPSTSGIAGKVLFYGSVFFLVSGLCVLFLSWVREKKSTREDLPERLGISFREGVLLGAMVVAILILQSFRVLVWWVAVLLGIVFLFVEVIFLMRPRKK